MELLAASVVDIGSVRMIRGSLVCSFNLPGGSKKDSRILALGHGDTVWPLGTLRTMKYRRAEGRLWGPGVLDMEGNGVLAFFIFAMRASARTPDSRRASKSCCW